MKKRNENVPGKLQPPQTFIYFIDNSILMIQI